MITKCQILLATLLCGCVSQHSVVSKDLPPIWEGQEYHVTVKDNSAKLHQSYEGVISNVDANTIVMKDVTHTTWGDTSTPLLKDLPVLGRHFTSSTQRSKGPMAEVRIDRNNIECVSLSEDYWRGWDRLESLVPENAQSLIDTETEVMGRSETGSE